MCARRSGFTLVELLVAITLLGVGVAAWVSTSAVALRTAAEAERQLATLRLLREAAERLAARCAPPGAGERDGTRWTVTIAGAGVRLVRVEALDSSGTDGSVGAAAEIAAACPP